MMIVWLVEAVTVGAGIPEGVGFELRKSSPAVSHASILGAILADDAQQRG